MNYLNVNKLSVVPIYVQLRDSIRSAILDGSLPNLTELPREEEVCSLIHISRLIVRRAYQELIDEGLVRRQKWKSPVVFRHLEFTLPVKSLPDIDDIIELDYHISRKLIVSELVKDSKMEDLKFIEATYRITTITLADKIPIYRQDIYLPLSYFPKLSRINLTKGSILDIIRKEYGIQVKEIKNFGYQKDLSRIDIKLLMLDDTNGVGMVVESSLYNADKERIAVIETLYPGEYHHFIVEGGL
ncbi:MAG: GntR family transcriptional regulator [Erysipelotrichaceae bacterium]